MKITTIIFDLDGTLYDSTGLPEKLIVKELSRLALLRIAAERKARKMLAGVPFGSTGEFYDKFFSLIAKYSLCSREKAEKWYREQYMPDFVEILHKHFHYRKGLNEMVAALKGKGFKVAVFSDYGSVAQKMEALGIKTELFDALLDAPSLGGLKPCGESFRKALAAVGADPDTSLMIGDRDDTDGEGARAAGMQFVRIFKSETATHDTNEETGSEETIDSVIGAEEAGKKRPAGNNEAPLTWKELSDMLMGLPAE